MDSVHQCTEIDPRNDLHAFLNPGEVGAVLDRTLPKPGRSSEYRSGQDRYFLIEINPDKANTFTYRHERRHISIGTTTVRVPGWLRDPTNFVLDLMFIDPYLLLEDCWPGILVFLAIVAWWWTRRARHPSKDTSSGYN